MIILERAFKSLWAMNVREANSQTPPDKGLRQRAEFQKTKPCATGLPMRRRVCYLLDTTR